MKGPLQGDVHEAGFETYSLRFGCFTQDMCIMALRKEIFDFDVTEPKLNVMNTPKGTSKFSSVRSAAVSETWAYDLQ